MKRRQISNVLLIDAALLASLCLAGFWLKHLKLK